MNAVGLFKYLDKQLREINFERKKTSNIKIVWKMKTHKMLLCSHSPNVVPPAPTPSAERIHSRGTGRRASAQDTQDSPQIYIKLFSMGS